MDVCIFCQIVAGEIPAEIVWEDENYLAFLDIEPVSKGHTLLIPKKHYRWVWDVPDFAGYFEKTKDVKKVLDKKYKSFFMQIGVMGVKAPHAHIHLIPRYEMKETT